MKRRAGLQFKWDGKRIRDNENTLRHERHLIQSKGYLGRLPVGGGITHRRPGSDKKHTVHRNEKVILLKQPVLAGMDFIPQIL